MYEKTDAGNGKYCQIRMVLQSKSDNSNGHALLYLLLWMVLQNKSDKEIFRETILRNFAKICSFSHHFRFSRKWKKHFRFNPIHNLCLMVETLMRKVKTSLLKLIQFLSTVSIHVVYNKFGVVAIEAASCFFYIFSASFGI
jgi:hypothetical protein